jgi:hypothetical protein
MKHGCLAVITQPSTKREHSTIKMDTITLQPSKTPSHTAESRVENSSQVTNNTPKPRVETTITPQPIKTTSNTAKPRVENSSQNPRAESQELRAKS